MLPEEFDFLADLGRITYPSSTLKRGKIVGLQLHFIISVLLGVIMIYINSLLIQITTPFIKIIFKFSIINYFYLILIPFFYMNTKWFVKLHHGIFGSDFDWKKTTLTTLGIHLLFAIIFRLGIWLIPL